MFVFSFSIGRLKSSFTHFIKFKARKNKRFLVETTTADKRFNFISESKNSKLLFVAVSENLKVNVTYKERRKKFEKEFDLEELIDPKGWRAIGNKFPVQEIQKVESIAPEEVEEVKEDISASESANPENQSIPDADGSKPDFIEQLKTEIKTEVEEEDSQLGLFGGDTEK